LSPQLLPLCSILAARLRRQCNIRLLGYLLQFGISGAVISDHALRGLLICADVALCSAS
jgi:hypothetical protein